MVQNETTAAAAETIVRTKREGGEIPFASPCGLRDDGWSGARGGGVWWRRRNNDVSANEVSDGITAAAAVAHIICRMCDRLVYNSAVINGLPIVIIGVITGRA